MSMSIERSAVTGIFPERTQADQAVEELRRAGFADDVIGVAGRDEVAEGLGLGEAKKESVIADFVVVTVEAGERMQDALQVLLQCGASEVHPAQQELADERPVAVASQGYGLQRDPSVDGNTSVADSNMTENAVAEEEGDDTFFGQTILPEGVQPGSPEDPNVRKPRTV